MGWGVWIYLGPYNIYHFHITYNLSDRCLASAAGSYWPSIDKRCI